MTIPELILTDKELCDAVHSFLAAQGIPVPVDDVSKNYSGGGWRVKLQEPIEPKPPEPKEES